MITLKVRTTSWSIRSSRETRKITTVVLKLSFSYIFFCFRRLTPLLLLARGAMLRATHVASVSRQDCRALFAKLSDVEHQLEPCDDGRRAAVRLKRDSNTVPGPRVSRGCWARGAPGLKGALGGGR